MVLYNLASECRNMTSFSNELVMKTNSQGHFTNLTPLTQTFPLSIKLSKSLTFLRQIISSNCRGFI